jgi:hypothetical protein
LEIPFPMNKEYNSRQRKIYSDHNGYSNDSLFEMIHNRNKYVPEVIEIVEDILVERNAMFRSAEKLKTKNEDVIKSIDYKKEVPINEEQSNEEEVKSFVKKLQEKSAGELSGIITKYISYQQETVEAALFLSVEKGIISFDLKEKLLKQIKENFAAHRKSVKRFIWESHNAFIPYVSGYSDDEIYNIIEDPSGIVLDVFHAILTVAKERELITNDDFTRQYNDAKSAIRSDDEVFKDEVDGYFRSDDPSSDFESEAEMEAEKEKYWKCPNCNNLVGMEFGVCWNCQTEIPAVIEHPDTEEIIKEKVSQREFNPIKTGFILIVCGGIVCLLGFGRGYTYSHFRSLYYGRMAFGIFFIIIGFFFILYGLFNKPKTE